MKTTAHSGSGTLLREYFVWDRTTRIFHWINVLAVIGLIAVGLVILNAKALGVSDDGKILLKTIHAYIGYIFCLNLIWRLVWMFVGNRYAHWKSILPLGGEYKAELQGYVSGLKEGKPPGYMGHNPLARLMVALLFLLLTAQATTGIILAGTDLYLPPFGHEIAEWVTGAGEDHQKLEQLKPGSKEFVDPAGYAEMREFRKPIITVHLYSFYILLAAIFLHIAAVVVTESRERNGLVSAMFTGRKVFAETPVDADEERS